MRRFFRENALLILSFGLFFGVFFLGQVATGEREYNDDQKSHGEPEVGLTEYLGTGHFREATFENWESEFLQMGTYVLMTVWFRQKGSPESKKLDEKDPVDEDPEQHRNDAEAPGPVRRGGLSLALYRNSLSLAFFVLFIGALLLHANGGASDYNAEQAVHGGHALSTFGYMTTSRFWFESLQNWQSEFLAIGALVGLSIFLRQQGSPESKPVHAPHSYTGSG